MSASYVVDLGAVVVSGQTVVPKSITATESGTAIDFKEGQEPCNVILNAGAFTNGTAPTVVATMQESSDGTTGWGAPPQGAQTVSVSAAAPQAFLMFYRTKRYVRAVLTLTGTPDAVLVECTVLAQQIMTGGAYGGSSNAPQT